MSDNIIELFERVQKVPYYCLEHRDYEKMFKLKKGSCWEKNIWLGKELRKHGIKVKFYLIEFDWFTLPVPKDIFELRKHVGHHIALKAKIGGKWIWIDPTWDPPLAKAGFPVTINWNGKNNTKLAVKPIKMKLIKPKDKITIKTNQEFFNAINSYLDRIRKDGKK